MKRIGPDLKMPKLKGGDVKVPPFLSDLYYDLRDRRLLPLVVLILVAIVATPFLLQSGSDGIEPVPAPVAPATGLKPASKTLTVVKAAPGLRNYKKRLARRDPTNPFQQRYTAPVLAGSELNEEVTTTTTESGESSSGESSGESTAAPGESSPPSSGGGPPPQSGQLTFFAFAVDVRISRAKTKPNGGIERSEPETRERVLAPAPLPSPKVPVVTFMGVAGKDQMPLFMVSEDVSAVFGEGKCISGTSHCQLIELEPNQPEIFEYGENDVRYKISVLKVKPVVTGHS